MGRTVSLFFSETVPADELVRVAVDLGGQIQDEQCIDLGFSEGAAHVWIYDALSNLDDLREQPDGYNYPLPFGNPSKANLHMTLSHELESAALALKIAAGFLSRWPGVASFPLHTVLVRGDATDALPQTAAKGFAGFEVQVLLSKEPSLGALIDEFSGTIITAGNAAMFADALAEAQNKSRVDMARDTVVGVMEARRGRLWILVRKFEHLNTYKWDILAPTVERHVRPSPPSFTIRVLVDCSPDDTESMESADVLALSFSRRASQMYESVLFGTFFVALEPEQVKLVLDSGQWPLVT